MEPANQNRPSLAETLQKAWLKRGWLACLLWPLSTLFGLAALVRRKCYDCGIFKSRHPGVPVVVIGNVIAGGSGKTPLVIALVRHLEAQAISAGVISRGYGRHDTHCREVLSDTPIAQSGDEAALIKRLTGVPVFVARKRVEAARALLLAYPGTQVLVCDDGLQHYAMRRDIEVIVFDDRGTANGWLLPAGLLREPWPRTTQTPVNLVLHSGHSPAFEGYRATRRLADHAVSATGEKIAMDSLRGRTVSALAAIANPEAFFSMLRNAGLTLEHTLSLPDHFDFSEYTVPGTSSFMLCTEKDAVKLFALPKKPGVTVLAVPLEFVPESAFLTAVDEALARLLPPRPPVTPLPSSHGH